MHLFPTLLSLACISAAAVSCSDDPNFDRTGNIVWSLSADFSSPGQWNKQNWIVVPVEGVNENYIYIKSREEVSVYFETEDPEDGEDQVTNPSDWLKIVEIRRNVSPDVDCVVYRVDPHPGIYEKRTGCITLAAGSLNDYIQVRQGYDIRVNGAFDWLKYGSTDPLATSGEVLFANWSTQQKEYGWTSEPAEEEGTAYCYGKNGYIRLGDDARHGANIITPYTPALASDTAILVRFNAVAYTAPDGTPDNNRLTVRVLGGGMFLDGSTEKQIAVKHLDPEAEELPTSMWEGSAQQFYVVSWPQSRITGATRIELMAGDYTMEKDCNRIFIDDLYLFRLQWLDDYDRLFGGLPGTGEQKQ